MVGFGKLMMVSIQLGRRHFSDSPFFNSSVMVNTITLSSDMNTLYLIDDERAIPFDLTSGNGVLIGTLLGQVTVATAIVDPKGTKDSSLAKDKEQTIELKNSQWTIMFNPENLLFHVVGETEIDFFVSSGNGPQPQQTTINLKDKIVILKKVGTKLTINTIEPSSKSV